MPRELLKFREGDCGLKIRKDGKLEVAGVDESGGMINENGMVNPVLLFAAAWARRDQKVFQALVDNFKESVREGFFGPDAKTDYEKALKVQEDLNEKEVDVVPSSAPDVKPVASTADAASGAVTLEQPQPLDVKGHLDRRDS